VAVLLNDSTGYIKSIDLPRQHLRSLRQDDQIKSRELHLLIINLRDNGGGYMDEAIEVAELLRRKIKY
jgi:carboxyl-terminal processing protease